jgi:hypothetical protein
MKRFDFYNLPRDLQDRLIESTQGVAVPLAIAARPFSSKKATLWGSLAIVFLVLLAGAAFLGFGDLSSPYALGGPIQLGTYIALAFLSLFCAARAYWVAQANAQLPYATADYLFPSGILEVRGSKIFSYDAKDIELKAVTGPVLTAKVRSGPSFDFIFKDQNGARAAQTNFEDSKRRWIEAENGDPLEKARLSCLVESGIPNPLAPTRPHTRPRSAPAVLSYLAALILAGLVGVGLGLFRNELSEQAMFRLATSENSVAAFQKYVARGGTRAEVRELLLPRARLAQAMKSSEVEDVIAFAKTSDASKIRTEVEAAVRVALLQKLADAQKQGTLTALSELANKYPETTLIQSELAQARHTIYQTAYQSFAERGASDKSLIEFVGHLLAYAEKAGPKVMLRLVHEFPQDTEIVDTIVKKSEKYYLGAKSLPSPHFLGERARKREQSLGDKLVAALSELFPKDVLEFELAPLPEKENVPPEPISIPTLTITHRETLSGGYVGGAPKNMYMGATVRITALFQLPGDRPKHEFAFSTWKNPSSSITEQRPTDIDAVYEDMMSGALEEFRQAYLKKWLKA